jgi:hypothetical protein
VSCCSTLLNPLAATGDERVQPGSAPTTWSSPTS